MSKRPTARHTIFQIEPYVPGSSTAAPGVENVCKLSSNETPLGASPAAVEAFHRAAAKLHLYPDGAASLLRRTIGEHYGIHPERIVCGNGSDDLLHLLAQIYLNDGDEAIHTQHGFLVYPIAIRAAGGTPVVAKEKDFTADVDSILARVSARTRIVFLANPNNPTGTYLPLSELKRLRHALREDILLVLDAAYAEYVEEDDYEAGFELVATHHNVVMTRTFSKVYGLAALRLGWCYASAEIVDMLNRVRGPFNVNSAALLAGVAAFEDEAHLARAIAHNSAERARVQKALDELGLACPPSVGNFLMIRFPDTPGFTAHEADAALQAEGVILRRLDNYHLPNALRMSIGTVEANDRALSVLRRFLSRRGR